MCFIQKDVFVSKVVMKYMKKSMLTDDYRDPTSGELFEVATLRRLEHPNIIKLCDVLQSPTELCLVMEYFGNGTDLFQFLQDHAPFIDEHTGKVIFRQLLDALIYCHDKDIVHRDIKEENVLVDDQLRVKLCDFGSAAFVEPDTMFTAFYGTVEYCSPEVLLGT